MEEALETSYQFERDLVDDDGASRRGFGWQGTPWGEAPAQALARHQATAA